MVFFPLQPSQHSVLARRVVAVGTVLPLEFAGFRDSQQSRPLMRDFPSHKLTWGKTHSPKPFLSMEVLQKHPQAVLSMEV